MKLTKLLKEYNGDLEITGLSTNSKEVKPGDLFICIKGATVDRHDHIDEAINNGAVALLTSKDVVTTVPYVKVDDVNKIYKEVYASFYDHPDKDLTLIGVTGTDGKTSTTTIIQTLIGNDKCGYIGTNGYSCKAFNKESDNTTPGIETMYSILKEFKDAGCTYTSMEASSEGFYYKRLETFNFALGALTNIDKEHLNTHKTLENYIDCKKQLFRQSKIKILNSHDKYYSDFKKDFPDSYSYGYLKEDDLYIKNYQISPNNTLIDFVYENKEYNITSPLLGSFNVENLACALLSCLKLGFDINELLNKVPNLKVDGRMQSIDMGQDFYVLVDYAHTPNGLSRLFEFTNTLDVNKKIVVTGNAGQRDASKRKYVGELCVNNNDHVIFTYEDPRFEDPLNVISDLTELVRDKTNYETVVDRHDAIFKAIEIAKKNDLVMILGKGNENYEEIKGESIPFNDVEEAKKALKERLNKAR